MSASEGGVNVLLSLYFRVVFEEHKFWKPLDNPVTCLLMRLFVAGDSFSHFLQSYDLLVLCVGYFGISCRKRLSKCG